MERYRAALGRFFRRRMPDVGAECDDLVQDVFLKLASRQKNDQIEHPDRYIFHVASSVLVDRQRRRATRRVERHIDIDDVQVADEVSSPERVYASKQEVAIVLAAVEELPEKVRMAFVLHRFEDMTYREISKRLGVSVSSVEKYLAHALAHVTKRLEDGR